MMVYMAMWWFWLNRCSINRLVDALVHAYPHPTPYHTQPRGAQEEDEDEEDGSDDDDDEDDDDEDDEDDSSEEEEDTEVPLQESLAFGREKRATQGKRMQTLVGEEQEKDDEFWGDEKWKIDDAESEYSNESGACGKSGVGLVWSLLAGWALNYLIRFAPSR